MEQAALIEGATLHLGAGSLIGLDREGIITLASLSLILPLLLVLPIG